MTSAMQLHGHIKEHHKDLFQREGLLSDSYSASTNLVALILGGWMPRNSSTIGC